MTAAPLLEAQAVSFAYGAFLVQKRLALMGDGIGHLAFAGVALGTLAGVAPLGAALVLSAVGAVAIERLRTRGRASGDLVLACSSTPASPPAWCC